MADDKAIWAVDSETDPFRAGRVPDAFLWGAYNPYTGEWLEWDNTADFIEWAREQDAIMYAHNGGKFDWHYITSALEEYAAVMIIAGRLAKFKIGKAEFRDSWNILPAPLSKLGAKDEIDYHLLEKETRAAHMDKIRKYHKQDCVVLGRAIMNFIDRHGIKLTQAGAAMSLWESINGKADRTSPHFFERFSPYYYGGRVQCFEVGEIGDPFEVYDINSAYPHAMLSDHPSGSLYRVEDELPANDSELARSFIDMFAESTGAFPYRNDEGGLDFPADGKFRSFRVTGWEYIAARDTDTLGRHTVGAVYMFDETINFKDYIEPLYKERAALKAADDEREILPKFDMNALYGKYGANPDKYREYMTIPFSDVLAAREDGGWEFDGRTEELALMSRPINEHRKRFYNVATAASITGYVRANIWRGVCATDRPLYCDTDCIVGMGISGLDMDSARLGAWDCEAKCDYGAIAGKKLYAFKLTNSEKHKTASKGVKLGAEQIIRVAKGETVKYENDAPTFSLKVDKSGSKARFIKRNVKRTTI